MSSHVPGARWSRTSACVLVTVALAGVLPLGASGVAGAAGAPAVVISPAPSGGQYQNGQTVSVSVGPNFFFVPNSRVVILECADPGGTESDLPTAFIDCDGNTIQGDTVSVQANGSFSETSYTIYSLPNSALGESRTNTPVCSASQACVLFVGEDQNDFTRPKAFSTSFTVAGAGITGPGATPPGSPGQPSTASGSSSGGAAPTAVAGGGTGTGGSGSGGSAAAEPGVASSSAGTSTGSLAFTGTPDWLLPLMTLGMLLFLVGTGGLLVLGNRRLALARGKRP